MDGNDTDRLIKHCVELLTAWAGPGQDQEGLQAVAAAIDALGAHSMQPSYLACYEDMVDAWLAFIQALEACDPAWPTQRTLLIIDLEAWSLSLSMVNCNQKQ